MKSKEATNLISYKWYNSLEQISPEDWRNIFGDTKIKSYELFVSMEKSKFDKVNLWYLYVSKNNDIQAIIPCFSYILDFGNILSNSKVKRMIYKVRKLYSNFLKLKVFVIGSYIATCEDFIGISANLDDSDYKEIINLIHTQLSLKAQVEKCWVNIVKDVRGSRLDYVKNILQHYSFHSTFPTTIIPLDNKLPYPKTLKKKQRKRHRDYIAEFQHSFSWECISGFGTYVSLFERLYTNVLNKAKNKFEILDKVFFNQLNNMMGENIFLLIARDKDGSAKLIELVMEDGEKLLPLYLGIDYDGQNTKTLYLNAIFRTIKEAENRNKKFVEFGQTSYYPKVLSGALVEDVFYGFYSYHKTINMLICKALSRIFLPIKIPQNVYQEQYKTLVLEKCKKGGFLIINK